MGELIKVMSGLFKRPYFDRKVRVRMMNEHDKDFTCGQVYNGNLVFNKALGYYTVEIQDDYNSVWSFHSEDLSIRILLQPVVRDSEV